LHPNETRVPSRADLFQTEFDSGNFQEPIATFVQQQFSIAITCTNNFSFVRLINEIIGHRGGTCSELRRAGSLHSETVRQTHSIVHLETEIRDVRRSSFLEVFHQGLWYITWKLARSFLVPFRKDAFRIER